MKQTICYPFRDYKVGIYLIESPEGNVYVGQTWDIYKSLWDVILHLLRII